MLVKICDCLRIRWWVVSQNHVCLRCRCCNHLHKGEMWTNQALISTENPTKTSLGCRFSEWSNKVWNWSDWVDDIGDTFEASSPNLGLFPLLSVWKSLLEWVRRNVETRLDDQSELKMVSSSIGAGNVPCLTNSPCWTFSIWMKRS